MSQSLDHCSAGFDAVVLLTWSDWHTEPRSNRYHFATRFARHWPVYFVQWTDGGPNGEQIEPVEGHDIRIVHMGLDYGPEQSERLGELLRAAGVRSPLFWIYNPYFLDVVRRVPGRLSVYHGTEDYLGSDANLPLADDAMRGAFLQLFQMVDLSVAVTDGVARSIRVNGGFDGPELVLRNGCDTDQWRTALKNPSPVAAKIAIFQGTINARLDFDLLSDLIERMSDWTFYFCGKTTHAPQPAWNRLTSRLNVHSFGPVHPDRVAEMQARATVGLIPFRQLPLMKISLPLKAYEYVASGLPVVTIPINELAVEPDLFHTASTAEEFATAIRAVAPTRDMPEWLEKRAHAARGASYDVRFEELLSKMAEVMAGSATSRVASDPIATPPIEHARPAKAILPQKNPASQPSATERKTTRATAPMARPGQGPSRKRILVAYSASSTHVQTTLDYLTSLSRYMDADVEFLHVTNRAIPDCDLDAYDAIFNSYCARWPVAGYISPRFASALARFRGPKILAVQDEYDGTNDLKDAIRNMGFSAVLTCVPSDQIEKVYPRAEFPGVDFVTVLTGYVPEGGESVSTYALPLRDRPTLIGYRGRDIGGRYGRLAFDKLEVGRKMRAICEARGLRVDIDWTEDSRIYGVDWFKFLGSCRSTLGTESGSNVFDFDGSITSQFQEMAKQLGRRPSYEEFLPKVRMQDADMDIGQVSPRVFEAAALRTPMVLLRGRYSDVIQADRHYLPLERDYSNVDEVLKKLDDFDALQAMVDRTYDDLIASGAYGYPSFVGMIDRLIESKLSSSIRPKTAKNKTARPDPSATDDLDREFLTERPTREPMSRHEFESKTARREAAVYIRECQRLYTAVDAQRLAYEKEIARLNGEIARSLLAEQSAKNPVKSSSLAAAETLTEVAAPSPTQSGLVALRARVRRTPMLGPMAVWVRRIVRG
jgi:hypothetical protein